MTTLNDFYRTNLVDDHVAADINELISAALRSEFKNVESLSATRTLLDADTPLQRLNCNGANRIVKMPTADATENHPFFLYNSTASGTYTLTVQNNGGTINHAVLNPSEFVFMIPDGNGTYAALGRPFGTILTPSQITANQNDYNPTGAGSADVIRLSSDASRDLTGLAFMAAGGKSALLLNVGSNNIVLKDESASSAAANRFALSADVTIAADQGVLVWYDPTSSRVRVVGGTSSSSGGVPTISTISPTTADITATLVTGGWSMQTANLSGLTANRNYKIPAGTAGDRLTLVVTTGDDAYEFIIKGDTGITINGGSAATEWNRVFIADERVDLIATSTTNWLIIADGRIPCVTVLRRTGSDANITHDAGDFIHSTWNAAAINRGNCADLTNVRIKARRAGIYSVASAYAPVAAITDQNYAAIQIWLDATVTSGEITAGTRVASTALRQSSASSSIFGAAIPAKPVSATAGQYFYQSFSAQEASRGLLASDTASPVTLIEVNFFSVEENLPK